MEPFKCKTCGTALEALAAQSKNELVECPSCFNVWTIPRKETSPAAIAFLRMGEHELTLAQCSSCGERVPIGEAFSPEYIRALEKSRAEREERKRRLEEEQRNCFEIENGVLVKYNGKGEEAVVPEGVTEIGDHSFWGSNCSSLLRLKIPSSVEKISSVAFLHCYSLAVVTLPKRFKWQVGSLFFGMDKIIHFIYTK